MKDSSGSNDASIVSNMRHHERSPDEHKFVADLAGIERQLYAVEVRLEKSVMANDSMVCRRITNFKGLLVNVSGGGQANVKFGWILLAKRPRRLNLLPISRT